MKTVSIHKMCFGFDDDVKRVLKFPKARQECSGGERKGTTQENI